MKTLVILSAICVIAVGATNTAQGSEEPQVQMMGFSVKPAVKKATYLGKTAKQWHARAVWRTEQRNNFKQDVKRLRTILRYEIQVKGTHPTERGLLCIHSYEGAWNDPDAPYYGGLQMDMSFQKAYGPEFLRAWGTADHWPVSVQLAVGMRAYLSGRGYNPWPNTARYCNLLN